MTLVAQFVELNTTQLKTTQNAENIWFVYFSTTCCGRLLVANAETKNTYLFRTNCLVLGNEMAQAKTLTQQEIKQVLGSIALGKHAARNRAMFLLTCWGGLRVGEVAAVRYCDVVGENGKVRDEVRLLPNQTKGRVARTVFINERLQRELQQYADSREWQSDEKPFFYTQKSSGFTANTAAQHFHQLYKAAGVAGASSHSGRRTFITSLAAKGVSVRVLASLAGHANISTTQAYIDVNDEMKRKAVELA